MFLTMTVTFLVAVGKAEPSYPWITCPLAVTFWDWTCTIWNPWQHLPLYGMHVKKGINEVNNQFAQQRPLLGGNQTCMWAIFIILHNALLISLSVQQHFYVKYKIKVPIKSHTVSCMIHWCRITVCLIRLTYVKGYRISILLTLTKRSLMSTLPYKCCLSCT